MSQPAPRRSDSSSTPHRRLLTPEERFGVSSASSPASSSPEKTQADPFKATLENAPFMREIVPVSPDEEAHDETASPLETQPSSPGLQKLPSRHQKKKYERARVKGAAKHQAKHFERHALPGHESPQRPVSGRQARRRKVKRFAWRVVVLSLLFFAVQLGFAAFSAPQFSVKGVQVEGIKDTPESAIHPIVQKLIGQNIFRADRAAIEKSLETVPTVANARIKRVIWFPPKMRVVLTEREPLARVGAGKNWWVVDETGLPFREANKPGDEKLYALTAPQFEPQLNKPFAPRDWARARAVLVALRSDNARNENAQSENPQSENPQSENPQSENPQSENPQSDKNWKLRRVYLDKNGLASLRLSDPLHAELLVRLGDDDFERKLERARISLAYLKETGRNAEELNLLSFDFPRWKPKTVEQNETTNLARKSEFSDLNRLG